MQAKPTSAKKGEAATPAIEQGVAAEPKKERTRGKECAWIRPFTFREWGLAARPIGGHENLWNGICASSRRREAILSYGGSKRPFKGQSVLREAGRGAHPPGLAASRAVRH